MASDQRCIPKEERYLIISDFKMNEAKQPVKIDIILVSSVHVAKQIVTDFCCIVCGDLSFPTLCSACTVVLKMKFCMIM